MAQEIEDAARQQMEPAHRNRRGTKPLGGRRGKNAKDGGEVRIGGTSSFSPFDQAKMQQQQQQKKEEQEHAATAAAAGAAAAAGEKGQRRKTVIDGAVSAPTDAPAPAAPIAATGPSIRYRSIRVRCEKILNVRTSSDPEAPPLGKLYPGQVVTVIEERFFQGMCVPRTTARTFHTRPRGYRTHVSYKAARLSPAIPVLSTVLADMRTCVPPCTDVGDVLGCVALDSIGRNVDDAGANDDPADATFESGTGEQDASKPLTPFEQTSPGRSQTSPGRSQTSPGRSQASPGRSQTSPGRAQASPGRSQASARNKDASAESGDAAAATDSAAPSGGESGEGAQVADSAVDVTDATPLPPSAPSGPRGASHWDRLRALPISAPDAADKRLPPTPPAQQSDRLIGGLRGQVGWVWLIRGGMRLVTSRVQLGPGSRRAYSRQWERRKANDKVESTAKGMLQPSSLRLELESDPAGIGFAFGGVDPGLIHAHGELHEVCASPSLPSLAMPLPPYLYIQLTRLRHCNRIQL